MPVILISRGTMSGVNLLVKSLSDHLGYRCVSREDLIVKVNEHGEIANRIVRTIGHATRAYEHFSQLRRSYIILMRLALAEYICDESGCRGNLIYHGYSGHLLLPPMPDTLRVRINAPLEMRVSMTMDRLGCDERKAREHILSEDEKQGRWARFMYGRDIRDPGLYDMVLNLDRLPMRPICMLLESVARDPAFENTGENARAMERLLIATQIEAAAATDPKTEALEISAEVTDERVLLLGPWLEDEQAEAVAGLAAAYAKGRKIDYETGYAPVFDIPAEGRAQAR